MRKCYDANIDCQFPQKTSLWACLSKETPTPRPGPQNRPKPSRNLLPMEFWKLVNHITQHGPKTCNLTCLPP